MHTRLLCGCCCQHHLNIDAVLLRTHSGARSLLRRLLVAFFVVLSISSIQGAYAQSDSLFIDPDSENFPATPLEPEVSRSFTIFQSSSFGGTSMRLTSLFLCQGSCVNGNSELSADSSTTPAGSVVNEVNGTWTLAEFCDGSSDFCKAEVTFTGSELGSSTLQLVAEYETSFALSGGVERVTSYAAAMLESSSEVSAPVQTINISSGILSGPEGSQVPISVTRIVDPCCSGLEALTLSLSVASTSTATEGIDFAFTSSSNVTWGAGEVGEKIVLIDLLNDSVDEDVEQIDIVIEGSTLPPLAVVNNRLVEIAIQSELAVGEVLTRIVSGSDQGLLPGPIGEDFADLVVQVTGDGVGQPSTFVRVTWSVVPEGAATLLDNTSIADESGVASNRVVEITARGFIQIFATATVEQDFVVGSIPDTSNNSVGTIANQGSAAASMQVSSRITPPPAAELASNVARFILRSGFLPALGLTGNQSSTGGALDNACTSLTELDESDVNLSDAQDDLLTTCARLNGLVGSDGLGIALNRLMPEEAFAIADSSVEAADIQVTNIVSRINSLRSGNIRALDVVGLSFDYRGQHIPGAVFNAVQNALSATDAADTLLADTRRLGIFASGRLSVGEIDGAGNQKGADFSTQGVTLGADYRMSSKVVLGGSIGFTNVDTDFQADQDSLAVEGVSVSLFATLYEQDVAYVDAVLQAGNNTYDTVRRINLPEQRDMFANGSTESSIASFTIGAGRHFSHKNWEFGPYMRATVSSANVDGYTESAASSDQGEGSVLAIGSHSVRSTTVSAGVQISASISTQQVVWVPQFWIEGEFENETSKDDISASFVHDPTASVFTIAGNERDSAYANYGLGTSIFWPGFRSVFAFFESQLGHEFTTQYWLKFGTRFNF